MAKRNLDTFYSSGAASRAVDEAFGIGKKSTKFNASPFTKSVRRNDDKNLRNFDKGKTDVFKSSAYKSALIKEHKMGKHSADYLGNNSDCPMCGK